MAKVERSYAYQPKWISILFLFFFIGLLTLGLGYMALWNDRGLVINGIIELSTQNATILYWVLTALCAAGVLLSVLLAAKRLAIKHRIALTASSIIVPKSSWSVDETDIPYQNIREISMSEVHKQKFLHLHQQDGKYSIVASMLPSRKDFEELHNLLMERVKKAS